MPGKIVIGVMGGGEASRRDRDQAYRLGSFIAQQGWVLLNGGRDAGIMAASAQGASDHGGLTIGVLPDEDDRRKAEGGVPSEKSAHSDTREHTSAATGLSEMPANMH